MERKNEEGRNVQSKIEQSHEKKKHTHTQIERNILTMRKAAKNERTNDYTSFMSTVGNFPIMCACIIVSSSARYHFVFTVQ